MPPTELIRPCVFARTLLAAVIFSAALANTSCAQEPSEGDTTTTDTTAEKEASHPILDLGKFKINDLRPTRNMTAKLTFKLHLAFSKSLTKTQVEKLERWKHRLRDQVIVAIRITEAKEFQEPDLSRFQKKILIRVNRLFQSKIAEEVLLTEYLFRTH